LFAPVATVGGLTLASRALGLVRDLLIAAALGAGPLADAFFLALRLPNLFRALFAEGAFSAAFVPVFAAPGDSPEELAPLVRRAKTQIAFYGTTPNYSFQFTDLGYEGVTAALRERMAAGDIAGMADCITDDVLEHFALVAPWNEMADRLKDRYTGTASRVVMYLAEEQIRKDPDMVHKWGDVAQATRS